ncbi:hypothetical protein N7497_009030 [Penicillium chrysogenum]|nr:hypothetical protein N7497_009030 [Penicillium chrysogenum]
MAFCPMVLPRASFDVTQVQVLHHLQELHEAARRLGRLGLGEFGRYYELDRFENFQKFLYQV